MTLMVKSVQPLGAQAARLPRAGVCQRQTPTPPLRSLRLCGETACHSPFTILHAPFPPDPSWTLMVHAVLVVETLHATSLPRHLFVVFVIFVVPARTLPSESSYGVVTNWYACSSIAALSTIAPNSSSRYRPSKASSAARPRASG